MDSQQRIYLDRGAGAGLSPGQELTVERQGKAVAKLKVLEVSAGRAAASVMGSGRALRRGDMALFAAEPPEAPPEPTRSLEEPPALEVALIAGAWKQALMAQERALVVYEGATGAESYRRVRARAGSDFMSRAYFWATPPAAQ